MIQQFTVGISMLTWFQHAVMKSSFRQMLSQTKTESNEGLNDDENGEND